LILGKNDLYIRKTVGDSFLRTELQDKLKSLNISDLIICGYASEFCMDNTIRRATGLGYTVQLVSDAHTTHDKEHLSAEIIRNHHNITLSMGPTITAVATEDVELNG
jgi:nicotinamidase-related amidase